MHPSAFDHSPLRPDTVLQFPRPCCSHNFAGPSELPWERGGVGCADLPVYVVVKYYIRLPLCEDWKKEKCEKTEVKGKKDPPDPNTIRIVAHWLVSCKSCSLGLSSLGVTQTAFPPFPLKMQFER